MPNTQQSTSVFSVEKRVIEPSLREGELFYTSNYEAKSSFPYAREDLVNTSAPVLTGDFKIPAILSVTEGVYSGNPMAHTYLYSWWRDDLQISGEIGNTYTTVASDDGKSITVQVTAISSSNVVVTPSNGIGAVLYQPIEVLEAEIYALTGLAIPNSLSVMEWTPYIITGLPVENSLMVAEYDVYIVTM